MKTGDVEIDLFLLKIIHRIEFNIHKKAAGLGTPSCATGGDDATREKGSAFKPSGLFNQ